MPFTYEEDTIREYWNFCGAIESLEVLRSLKNDVLHSTSADARSDPAWDTP